MVSKFYRIWPEPTWDPDWEWHCDALGSRLERLQNVYAEPGGPDSHRDPTEWDRRGFRIAKVMQGPDRLANLVKPEWLFECDEDGNLNEDLIPSPTALEKGKFYRFRWRRKPAKPLEGHWWDTDWEKSFGPNVDEVFTYAGTGPNHTLQGLPGFARKDTPPDDARNYAHPSWLIECDENGEPVAPGRETPNVDDIDVLRGDIELLKSDLQEKDAEIRELSDRSQIDMDVISEMHQKIQAYDRDLRAARKDTFHVKIETVQEDGEIVERVFEGPTPAILAEVEAENAHLVEAYKKLAAGLRALIQGELTPGTLVYDVVSGEDMGVIVKDEGETVVVYRGPEKKCQKHWKVALRRRAPASVGEPIGEPVKLVPTVAAFLLPALVFLPPLTYLLLCHVGVL